MAWRIEEHLIRGEIDNRTRGRVTGRLWFAGLEAPVELELEGDAWRDVAGHLLRFTNPSPKVATAAMFEGFAPRQRGVVGDITASRKVKVPDCSMDELLALMDAGKPFTWHWGNSLYLEWHSETNGRVLIESAGYRIEIDDEAAWTMTEADEEARRAANGRAMTAFMQRLSGDQAGGEPDEDDDAPTSEGEAQADAQTARMDLLLDRVMARLQRAREAGETPDHARIMEEESARLRRERGEPEPRPPTPEEEAERASWIEEMHAAAHEAAEAAAAGDWEDDEDEERHHPLVARCLALWSRLREDCRQRGWLAGHEPQEHPLNELMTGVMIAGPKLAGALDSIEEGDWPPEPLLAGHTLVRLKKARAHLRDSLAGADAAAEQALAEAAWLATARSEVAGLVAEVETLIAEVRAVLEADADDRA